MIKPLLKRLLIQLKKVTKIALPDPAKKDKEISTNLPTEFLINTTIEIGENTFIDNHCSIGSYTYIGSNTYITKAIIGRYCSIGNNVSIGPGEHDLNKISTSAWFYQSPYDTLTQKECVIGNDVWIGVDCIIKRGVTISDGAVIGANSVVTKDVPPYAIVVGSPAKVLKYRFDDKGVHVLMASGWWNYDLDEAKEAHEKLRSIINT
ncbi:CatB-related O-acetyltransferase [Inquilinus sp. KBS0705]|nr:CatB-related O-acetyltransferase [Inquilinus sp. KBS0705]